MRREPLLFAFHDGTVYTFERTDRHSASFFGGPLDLKITGEAFGPKPLHHIARLCSRHLPVIGKHHFFDLPLIFGMQFDGCELLYRRANTSEIEVLRITPAESIEDWPYPNYPPLLPYVPLRLDDMTTLESYDTFAQRFPNMPWPQPTELVVAVQPPATIGMSLWGSHAGDEVTIVFECDLEKQQIKSYSLTD